MKGGNIIGVGCFAKPATLKRVFQKIISRYAPEAVESIVVEAMDKIFGSTYVGRPEASVAAHLPMRAGATVRDMGSRQVTGFFLSRKGRRLDLAIFTKGECARRQRYLFTIEDA